MYALKLLKIVLFWVVLFVLLVIAIAVVNFIDKIRGKKENTKEAKKPKKGNPKGEFIENDLGKFSVFENKSFGIKTYNIMLDWPGSEEGVEVEIQTEKDAGAYLSRRI